MKSTNTWILDSEISNHTKNLISQIDHAALMELSFKGELDQFILDAVEPFLDEYNELSKNHSQDHLESNTTQLMAKEWLYKQIEDYLKTKL